MNYLYLLGCLFFVFLQGFFSASEISFISSSALKLRHRRDKGDKNAKRVYESIMNPEGFLIVTLIGTNISVVLSSSFLTFFLIKMGVSSSNLWITFIFTPFVVVFAELIPKNIGRFFREDFSCKAAGLFGFFKKIFLPIVKIIEVISKFLIRLFIKKAKHRSPFVTKEEIRLLVKEIESQGGIDKGEKEAIEEVFEFRSDRVKDICVEVKKAAALDYADPYETVLETVKRHNYTRYPVFKNKEAAGYLNIYDLFYGNSRNWQSFIRPVIKVGLNQKLQDVFTRLQSQKESMALVFKGRKVYGIITMEDIVREIITSIVKA